MLKRVIEATKSFMAKELGLDATVVAVDPAGDGWVATAEAIIVDEYMRRLARKDLVTTFELRLDGKCEVVSYARKSMRERGSVTP